MVSGAPTPPPGRPGVTYAEVATHYGLSSRYVAESSRWGRHPEWPPRIGKRGRSDEFDPSAVAAFVDRRHGRTLNVMPDRLYTVQEAAQAVGLAKETIYADISRGRWPPPDETYPDGTKQWRGETILKTMAKRRGYSR